MCLRLCSNTLGSLREPATTLTDYLLAVVAVIGLVRLMRAADGKRLVGAQMFFAGFAAAALCGGTWHGFFSGSASTTPCALWWLTLVCSGVASSGLAVVGLERLGWRHPRALLLGSAIFVAAFATYAWWDRRFLVSVGVSIAATVLCLAGLAEQSRRGRPRGARLAAAGLVLSVLGGVLQQLGVAIHPVHFDHNATYHLWLFVALPLFHAGNQRIATSEAG